MISKVVCVMAIHQRVAMTLETIEMLQRQTHPIEIVLVGDSEVEQGIAKRTGCHYVQHANRPLGAKYQAGVDFARRLSPDVLMTTGSDSWVSLDWVERMLPYLSTYNCVGQNRWYILNLQRDNMRIVGPGHGLYQYQGERVGEPLGVGRLITHEGLQMMDWQIYPLQADRRLDGNVYRRMLHARLSVGIMNEVPVEILGIKGPWEVISRWAERRDNQYLPRPERWLDEHFPGGLKALERVRVACWPDKMAPFLTIVTRCCYRPDSLDKTIKSVQAQTCKDFEQLFLVDRKRRGMRYANEQFERHRTIPRGEYIYHLDDDDLLSDQHFVEKVHKHAIKADWPDVILVRSEQRTPRQQLLPPAHVWGLNWEVGERPKQWVGNGCCFVVKSEVWRANVWRYYHGQGTEWRTGGDWKFMTGLIGFGPALRIMRLDVIGGQGWRGRGQVETGDKNWFDEVAKRWGLEALGNDVWRLRHDADS